MSAQHEIVAQIHALMQLKPDNDEDAIIIILKDLKQKCTNGSEIQNLIADNNDFLAYLQKLLAADVPIVHRNVWLLLANTIVQNVHTQELIWQAFGSIILEECARPPLSYINNVQLMISYNIFLSKLQIITKETLLQLTACYWQAVIDEKCEQRHEYLHLIFEHFLVHDWRAGLSAFDNISSEYTIPILDYLLTYIRHDSPNGAVQINWMRHISKEFKLKSDWILRTTKPSTDENLKPREVYALLRVLASATGSEQYAKYFTTDHSLFLNVSSVLRALVAVGKQDSPNTFTPMTKLEEVTPNSPLPRDFELEISYELKTLLVRCVANLLYKNKTNQEYCLDTQLLPTLFESTNLDARNPLLKEWSILAIRNACDGCPQIQEVVANLTKVADAPNSILKELNLQMGSLRIKPDVA